MVKRGRKAEEWKGVYRKNPDGSCIPPAVPKVDKRGHHICGKKKD